MVDRRAWTLLLMLSAIWGASYMLIKIGIRDFSPGMVAFLRIALGAAVLLAIAARRGALGGFAADRDRGAARRGPGRRAVPVDRRR